MGIINEYLKKIKEAVYGEEVRSSIHDAIEQCYKDATGHPDSVAAVVERLKIEKGRIDELATSQTFTGNYTQSNLVFHAYRNATTGDPDPDDSYNYEGTSGKHEMPICKIFQEGTLDFAEKQSNEKVKILKEGLYIFELRIFISGSGKLDIEARINDVSQRYNAWQIVAQSTEETKIIAYILYLKGDDVVSFYGTPGLQASVRAPVSDVNCYVLDWIGKAQISDCSKEISDIRVGEDGTVYGTAGEAVRKQIGNLTEDLGNLDSDLYSISSNILDTNGLLENTAIKDWGNPTIDNYTYESAGKYSTRPIPVLADEIYKSIGYEFCYILFNSDGSFTTGNSLLNSTVGTIKIPNGIGYIVFMFSNYSNISTGIMRVESEQETPVYKPYGEKEKKYATVGDIEEVKEQIDNVTTTEPSKNVLLDGVLLENTDLKTWETVTINNYNYASTGKYSTSLIDCKSGDVFYPVFSNGKGSPSMGYTIFDANGNMIDHDWTVSKSNCVVPVGGTKAAFMFNNKKYDGLMLYTSVNNIPVFETTDPKEKYAKVETTDHYPMYDYGGMEIKMVGKILCIGDSYTEGGFDRKEGDTTYYFSDTELSYPSNLERITGCNVTNKGDGGKTCETWWNAHANDDLSGHKICIIQIGINDTNKQEDGWNSISDVNLTNIVNKVRSENNGIPIFIATLPNEWAYGTSAYTVTNERIRSIANTLGLFVIDFEKENGFVFARDILGGHPTSFGTWEIAREWANAISAYLSDNKALFTKLQYVGTDYSY